MAWLFQLRLVDALRTIFQVNFHILLTVFSRGILLYADVFIVIMGAMRIGSFVVSSSSGTGEYVASKRWVHWHNSCACKPECW